MKTVLNIFVVLAVIAYPILIFSGLSFFSVRQVGIAIAILIAIRLGFSLIGEKVSIKPLLPLVVGSVIPITIAIIINSELALRFLPVMINVSMLIVFGSSLRTVPMIERFARMQTSTLSAAQRSHCRQFTQLWCLFFIFNIIVVLLLSWAPLSWWAFYTGGLNYGLMGVLFVGEFLVRRYRFREYSGHFWDRFLLRILPKGAQ